MHLYELTQEMNDLLEAEEVEESALARVFGDIQAKGENICKFLATVGADIEAFKAEEKRIQARRKAMENRVEYIREYLKVNMESLGIDTLKAGTFTVKLQVNPPALVVDDENQIPTKYFTIIPAHTELNKAEVKDALKSGEAIPGAHLEQGRSVRIR